MAAFVVPMEKLGNGLSDFEAFVVGGRDGTWRNAVVVPGVTR